MPRGQATVDDTITTSEKAIFQSNRHVTSMGLDAGGLITAPGDGGSAKAARFAVTSGSAATLRVRIAGQHASDKFVFIKAGESKELLGPGNSHDIEAIYVSTTSGTATFNWELIG